MSETLSYRCETCAAPAVVVAPGRDEIRELFLLVRAEPRRCWCWRCWCERYLPKQESA